MNAPLIPGSAPTGGALHARRCARHEAREAAARCPECGGFYCRECVTEHAGRLLCAPCLARRAADAAPRRRRLQGLRRGLRMAAGVTVLWLLFYWLGAVLVKIPPDFHDGTIWKKAAVEARP